ncbi:hypothetical protein SAMN04487827_1070 [Prevotella sp. khp7]|nr:hypothetical protein SAMN04487827_1070 [Prevotella sp. khp7]
MKNQMLVEVEEEQQEKFTLLFSKVGVVKLTLKGYLIMTPHHGKLLVISLLQTYLAL